MNAARWPYRVRQFWKAFTSRPDEADLIGIRKYLGPQEEAMFLKMHPSEQAHAIEVAQKIAQKSPEPPKHLMVAALLHDIGKSKYPLRPWDQALIVLGKALVPKQVRVWEAGPTRGWRKAFVVAAHHPAWGAEMALEAGASPEAAALIRSHQTPIANGAGLPESNILALLQTADDES